MQNFVQRGHNITIAAAPYAVDGGDGCLVGALFGIASDGADIGGEVVLATVGVYDMAKVNAQAIAIGDVLYWDDTARLVSTVSVGNTRIGVCVNSPSINPSGTVTCRLNGSF